MGVGDTPATPTLSAKGGRGAKPLENALTVLSLWDLVPKSTKPIGNIMLSTLTAKLAKKAVSTLESPEFQKELRKQSLKTRFKELMNQLVEVDDEVAVAQMLNDLERSLIVWRSEEAKRKLS